MRAKSTKATARQGTSKKTVAPTRKRKAAKKLMAANEARNAAQATVATGATPKLETRHPENLDDYEGGRSTSHFYKYVTADRAIQILRDLSIRFSQPAALNDPYEGHALVDVEGVREHFVSGIEETGKPRVYAEDVFDRSFQSVLEAPLESIARVHATLGVLSLTEELDNILMWAHYGENHRGVVIEFHLDTPDLLIPSPGGDVLNRLGAVLYTSRKLKILPFPQDIVDALFRKSNEWSYEREWRIVRTLNRLRESSPGSEVYVCDLRPETIKSVVLGARIDPDKAKTIIDLLDMPKFAHTTKSHAWLTVGGFGLDILPLDQAALRSFYREHIFGEHWRLFDQFVDLRDLQRYAEKAEET